jgi:hypothetical protein
MQARRTKVVDSVRKAGPAQDIQDFNLCIAAPVDEYEN